MAVVAVAAVFAAGFVAGRATRSDGAAQRVGENGVEIDGEAATLDGPGDLVVDIPEGAFAETVIVTAEVAAPPPGLGGALVPASAFYEVDAAGAQPERPITLRFPAPTPPSTLDGHDEPAPVLLGAHFHEGEWLLLEAEVDGSTVTIETTSLSIFGIVRVAADVVADTTEDILEAVTGGLYVGAEDPDCSNGTDLATQRTTSGREVVSLRPARNDIVEWCASSDGDTTTVSLVNQRRYTVLIDYGDGAADDPQVTELSAQLSDLLTVDGQAVLAPGDRLTVTYPADEDAVIDVTYDGLAQSLTALIVSGEILAAIIGRFPGATGKTKSGREFLAALNLAECLPAAGIDLVDAAAPSNLAGSMTSLITECFDGAVLRSTFGSLAGAVLAAPLAVIGSTLAFLWSSGNAIGDLLSGDSDVRLRIAATDALGEDPDQTPAEGGEEDRDGAGGRTLSAWPSEDSEGSMAFYAYQGASFEITEWESCSRDYCIAGSGDEIIVYELDPLNRVGSFPAATTDPVATLIGVGFAAKEARILASPGRPDL